MKFKEIFYNRIGIHQLFYVTEEGIPPSVIAHAYTSIGMKKVKFDHLEFGLWRLCFDFEYGKYAFVIFEDEIAKIILIVTVE